MYHALFTLRPKVERASGFTCINIDEPGSAIGVESKWKSPSMPAHADSLGFWRKGRTMLTLKSHCSKSLHQYKIGNAGGNEAMVDLKHDLYVSTALSAGAQWRPGAVYWTRAS